MRKWNRPVSGIKTLILMLGGIVGLMLASGRLMAQPEPAPSKPVPAAHPEKWELLAPLVVERLDNGMTFLLYPNRRTPVFSGVIRFDVGGKNEHPGMTGIAHMFEHMAFKGTRRIGTTNGSAEQEALKKVESAAAALNQIRNQIEQTKALVPESAKGSLQRATEAFKEAQAEAEKYVVQNEFDEIYSREGGSDMNASTSSDATTYFISLPTNRLPLWASMESDRLTDPVMREFYSERDVVMEERRMRNDSSPMGQLWELTMSAAFTANPYGYPVIGWEADIRNLTATEAYEFFKSNYTPDRAVGVMVGEFDVAKTRQLLRETFGKIPARKEGREIQHILPEPPQRGERRVQLRIKASPMLLLGWHKPSLPDPADVQAEVLMQVLTGGRSSRWFEKLVKQDRLAADVSSFTGPGDALPNLFMIYATPQGKATLGQLEKALRDEVIRLRTEPVSAEELARAKKNLRADTIRQLETNLGLASRLAEMAQLSGDPYYLERRLRQLEAVTTEDLKKFAATCLVDDNLTVGEIPAPAAPAVP